MDLRAQADASMPASNNVSGSSETSECLDKACFAILSVRSLNMTLFVNLSQSKPARGHNMWSEREVEEQATKLRQACINWSQQRNLKPCFELY